MEHNFVHISVIRNGPKTCRPKVRMHEIVTRRRPLPPSRRWQWSRPSSRGRPSSACAASRAAAAAVEGVWPPPSWLEAPEGLGPSYRAASSESPLRPPSAIPAPARVPEESKNEKIGLFTYTRHNFPVIRLRVTFMAHKRFFSTGDFNKIGASLEKQKLWTSVFSIEF
jgi:hypothetical protein